MIAWLDNSDRTSRFYFGELSTSKSLSSKDAIRAMFELLRERIVGKGNAANFEVLMFEVNCDTGRLLAGASTKDGWKHNRTDGCSLRVQEVQDHWYDLIGADVPADRFSESINQKTLEIARLFRECIVAAQEELLSKAGSNGFEFVVFGSDPGQAILSESFVL